MKCMRCGTEDTYQRICSRCMSKWTDMRTQAWEYLTNKYGKLSKETLPVLQKEMKKLEKIWRKDPQLFISEITASKQINHEGSN